MLHRLLPLRVLVSLGLSFALIGVIVGAGAVFRDRHHRTHRPVTTVPRSYPSVAPLSRVDGTR